MHKLFRLVLTVLFILSYMPIPKAAAEATVPAPGVEPMISMDFQDAALPDVLKVFSIQSGMNFIASDTDAVKDRKITLYLDKVPLGRAMDKLFSANNLTYELDKKANIFVVKASVNTVTKVFYLKYATVSCSSLREEMSNLLESPTTTFETGSTESTSTTSSSGTGNFSGKGKWQVQDEAGITFAVKKLLSSSGSIIEDYRTNSLIVTDTAARMEVITQVVAALDVAVPQVLLEVEMLDVNKSVVDEIGVNWPQTLAYLTVPGSKGTSFPFGGSSVGTSSQDATITMTSIPTTMPTGAGTRTWDIGPWAASHFGPSIFTFLGTTLSFDYLRTRTDTKYLARPRIITLNNETAEIRIATNEAIGLSQSTTSTGGTGTTTSQAERTETGVILRVTPQINVDTGEVTMFVFPKVADASHTTTISAGTAFSYTFKDPEERSTKQVVKVKDGETIVIGGLIRNQSTTVVKKLPVLGDLPLVGGAFRHISKTPNEERELMVFITPHLVKDTKATAVAQLPVGKQAPVPQREQSTASAANSRQSAISKYIKNFEQ